jgi:hypothetical protein
MRHIALRLAVIALAAAALFGASPATASASTCYQDRVTLDYCSTTYASPNYKGWTYLASTCPRDAYCFWSGQISAWRWSGSSWSQASLRAGQWVYVYPYTGEWRWAWTQQTGWLATNQGKFEVRYLR